MATTPGSERYDTRVAHALERKSESQGGEDSQGEEEQGLKRDRQRTQIYDLPVELLMQIKDEVSRTETYEVLAEIVGDGPEVHYLRCYPFGFVSPIVNASTQLRRQLRAVHLQNIVYDLSYDVSQDTSAYGALGRIAAGLKFLDNRDDQDRILGVVLNLCGTSHPHLMAITDLCMAFSNDPCLSKFEVVTLDELYRQQQKTTLYNRETRNDGRFRLFLAFDNLRVWTSLFDRFAGSNPAAVAGGTYCSNDAIKVYHDIMLAVRDGWPANRDRSASIIFSHIANMVWPAESQLTDNAYLTYLRGYYWNNLRLEESSKSFAGRLLYSLRPSVEAARLSKGALSRLGWLKVIQAAQASYSDADVEDVSEVVMAGTEVESSTTAEASTSK